MKINHKILSLPPYVSTNWRDVQSLHQKEGVLFVSLMNGEIVQVPNLSTQTVEMIFSAHAAFLEEEAREEASTFPRQMVGGVSIESMGQMMQHNPEQSNAPNLPPDMLGKIADVARAIMPEGPEQLPRAEPHCNCMYCQIARAISGKPFDTDPKKESEEEIVEEKELQFRQWDVIQSGEQLFIVRNRLDSQESYQVYLGSPIGCTCGQQNCEHIIAALQS